MFPYVQAAHMEYKNRGRPLRKAWWGVREVARFMTIHLRDQTEGSDLGARAEWFEKGSEGKPAPMPQFILDKEKKLIESSSKVDPLQEARFNFLYLFFCGVLKARRDFSKYHDRPCHSPEKTQASVPASLSTEFETDSLAELMMVEFPEHGYEITKNKDHTAQISHQELPHECRLRCGTLVRIGRKTVHTYSYIYIHTYSY